MNKVEKNSERRPSEAASQGPLPDSENGEPENGTLDGTPTEQAEPMAEGDLTPGRARINRQEVDYNAKQMFNMATGKETRKRRRVEDTEEGKAEEADAATIRGGSFYISSIQPSVFPFKTPPLMRLASRVGASEWSASTGDVGC